MELERILEHCSNVDKKLQVHKNILSHKDLIENNYKIMQLYKPNMAPTNKRVVNYSVENFEFDYNKLNFTKLLFQDGQGSVNFTNLFRICRAISVDNS